MEDVFLFHGLDKAEELRVKLMKVSEFRFMGLVLMGPGFGLVFFSWFLGFVLMGSHRGLRVKLLKVGLR